MKGSVSRRQFNPSTWRDVHDSVGPLAERVYHALHLSHGWIGGFVRIREQQLRHESRARSVRDVCAALDELQHVGHLRWDRESGHVLIAGYLHDFPPANANHAKGLLGRLSALKPSTVRSEAIEMIEAREKQLANSQRTRRRRSRRRMPKASEEPIAADLQVGERDTPRAAARPGAQARLFADDGGHPSKCIFIAYTRWMVRWKQEQPDRVAQRDNAFNVEIEERCRRRWSAVDAFRKAGIPFEPRDAQAWDRYFEQCAKQLDWLDGKPEVDFLRLTDLRPLHGQVGMPEVCRKLESGHGLQRGCPPDRADH